MSDNDFAYRQHGLTVHVYMPDRNPLGLRIAESPTMTVRMLDVPRGDLSRVASKDDASRPGVYFLVGPSDGDDPRPRLYIGESNNVYKRLASHSRKKQWWDRVYVAVSATGHWMKNHTEALESSSIALAKASGSYLLDNGNKGYGNHINEPISADCADFMNSIEILSLTLGTTFFRAAPTSSPAPASAPATADVVKDPAAAPELESDFSRAVHDVIAAIPAGRWSTYGEVAKATGRTEMASRAVATICRKTDSIGAHRVLRAGGVISDGFQWNDGDDRRGAREVLEMEGLRFTSAGAADPQQFIDSDELANMLLATHRTSTMQPSQPVATKEDDAVAYEFHINHKHGQAFGHHSSDGFTVSAGSRAKPSTGTHELSVRQRANLLAQGVITPDGDAFLFARDHLFESPSAAARAVIGGSVNGRMVWKNADGAPFAGLDM